MVRAFGFRVLFMMAGMAIMILAFSSSSSSTSYSFSDMVFHGSGNCKMATTHNNRKLKEKSFFDTINEKKNKGDGKMNLEDYHPIDPPPTSKASIRHGPVPHGSPLMPHIPKPPSPNHPGLVPSPAA